MIPKEKTDEHELNEKNGLFNRQYDCKSTIDAAIKWIVEAASDRTFMWGVVMYKIFHRAVKL